jgi:formylmethanofuran dehydrogenase subunit E
LKFHGHKCPAMPMGIRAGLAAMNALGVKRAPDKELVVEAETARDMLRDASWTASWLPRALLTASLI